MVEFRASIFGILSSFSRVSVRSFAHPTQSAYRSFLPASIKQTHTLGILPLAIIRGLLTRPGYLSDNLLLFAQPRSSSTSIRITTSHQSFLEHKSGLSSLILWARAYTTTELDSG